MDIPIVLFYIGLVLSVILCGGLIQSIIARVRDKLKKRREDPPREIARYSSGDLKKGAKTMEDEVGLILTIV